MNKNDDSPSTRSLGALGEEMARKYLEKKGYRFIRSNFTVKGGEIDLVMLDKKEKLLVFCEVKTRTPKSVSFGEAWQAVDQRKRRHLTHAAKVYLARRPDEAEFCGARFDVVEIYLPEEGKKVFVRHTPDAFRATR